jgi:type VI secretion system secreted protein VgrG
VDIVIEKIKRELIEQNSDLHVKGSRFENIDGVQSLTVGGDQQEKIGNNHALEATKEIHIKAGTTLILEAGTQLSLKVGGNFIDIGPSGVAINGTPSVLINSGGKPATGSGSSPGRAADAGEAHPTKPDAADDARTGFKSAPGPSRSPTG